jgi:hypothetical protein
MKTVSAICIYKDNKIYNLTVNHNGNNTTLIHYDIENDKPYIHKNFKELHDDVLSVLKSNNFRCNKINEFEAELYDISFIDLNLPTTISKMYYK